MNVVTKNVALPDGRVITIETGKLAKQADGALMLRLGNTMLLATVCAAKDAVPGTDFMPLQVEYKEKYAAFGRFPATAGSQREDHDDCQQQCQNLFHFCSSNVPLIFFYYR